jgi:hypothetical protein
MFLRLENLPHFQIVFLVVPILGAESSQQRQSLEAIHEYAILADSAQRVIEGVRGTAIGVKFEVNGYIFETAIPNWGIYPFEEHELISRILTISVILGERDRTLVELAFDLRSLHSWL